jgi:hypothetical protein
MRARCTQLIIILSSMLLAACAGESIHQSVPDAARTGFTSTDVVLPIHQSEIYIFVPHSNAGASGGAAGGLLGALIGAAIDAGVDSERTSKAEAAVTPLRDATVDFIFDDALRTKLKDSLAQISWLHTDKMAVVRDVSNEGLDKTLTASNAAAVLYVIADYRLSNAGDAVLVTFVVRLIPNDDALRALHTGKHDDKVKVAAVNALYRNRFTFEARLKTVGERDNNIAQWSANHGAAARAALKLSIEKLVPLLVNDMQGTAVAGTEPVTVTLTQEITNCGVNTSGAQCGTKGLLVAKDQDGETVRFDDGSYKYLELSPAE